MPNNTFDAIQQFLALDPAQRQRRIEAFRQLKPTPTNPIIHPPDDDDVVDDDEAQIGDVVELLHLDDPDDDHPLDPETEAEIQMVLDRTRVPPRRAHPPRTLAAPIQNPKSKIQNSPPPPPPFHPFPTSALPQPVRDFVESGAQAIGCDASYIALPLLAGLAGAIGNARLLQLKRASHAPAIIWSATVGDGASASSPAFRLALAPFRDRQARLLQQHDEALYQRTTGYRRALDAWLDDPEGSPPTQLPCPRLERSIVVDTTLSALAPLLAENPRGLLLARDDLAGWVGAFARSELGSARLDATQWFPMHDGQSLLIDRHTGAKRNVFVERAALSVAGTLQPASLKRAIACGLASRLLLTWPPRPIQPQHWSASELDPQCEADLARLIERLHALESHVDASGRSNPLVLQFTKPALKAWQAWYDLHADEQAGLTDDLLAAWSNLQESAARLALVIHCVRCAADDPELRNPSVVDLDSLNAAVTLADWCKAETRRIYTLVGESEPERARRQLIDWIQRKGGSVTAREVQRSLRQYATADAAQAALQDLAATGIGRWEFSSTDGPGHPTRRFRLLDRENKDDEIN